MSPCLKGSCIHPFPPPNLSHMVQAWYVHVSWRRGICSVHSSTMISYTLATNMPVMHASTMSILVRTNTNVSMQKLCTQASPSHATCPSSASLQPSAPWLQASTHVHSGALLACIFQGVKFNTHCTRRNVFRCKRLQNSAMRKGSAMQTLCKQPGKVESRLAGWHRGCTHIHCTCLRCGAAQAQGEATAMRGEGLAERKLSHLFSVPAIQGR